MGTRIAATRKPSKLVGSSPLNYRSPLTNAPILYGVYSNPSTEPADFGTLVPDPIVPLVRTDPTCHFSSPLAGSNRICPGYASHGPCRSVSAGSHKYIRN